LLASVAKRGADEMAEPRSVAISSKTARRQSACRCSTCGSAGGQRWISQWISGSVVEGAPTEEPRPDASNARRQRPATRAIGASRALACVLNTRGFPQVFYTAPVIHPVRVHKYPWQASQCGMGSIPCRMYDVCRKKAGSLLGALRQNLSRLRVEKIGCLISTCGSSCPGSIHPLAQRSLRPHPQMNGRRIQSDCRDHPLCAF
jgi:hypothetical protein